MTARLFISAMIIMGICIVLALLQIPWVSVIAFGILLLLWVVMHSYPFLAEFIESKHPLALWIRKHYKG